MVEEYLKITQALPKDEFDVDEEEEKKHLTEEEWQKRVEERKKFCENQGEPFPWDGGKA